MSDYRIAAGALAALGAASAVPIPLAQLDCAGLVDAFNIDSGDSPRALLVMAGVGGFLTIAVLAVAFAGAGLALAGAPAARPLLLAAALAGLVTAMPLWIPAGVVIGVAGLALTLLLYAGSAWLVWSRWPGAAALLLGPAILAFLTANLFDWPWHVPASGALFAIALGGLIGAGRPTSGRP